MTFSADEVGQKPWRAVPELGRLLAHGSLLLFLGAGISRGFGLPSWPLLVARLLGRGDDDNLVKRLGRLGDQALREKVDEIDTNDVSFTKAVHKALYSGLNDRLSEQLTRSPLLLAVAALISGTCRGRISVVITFNFDDILEAYMQLLGLERHMREKPTDLTRRADLQINHVHGYLPRSWKEEDGKREVVLSERAYRKKRADIDKHWSAFVDHSLRSRIGLFLGLSGQDSSLLDILERVKQNSSNAAPYRGYWLMTPDAYKVKHKQIKELDMCPIPLVEAELPNYILGVCEAASHKM